MEFRYLFIDESGDPAFYGNQKELLIGSEGFQPYLIMGMIETADRKTLRKAVIGFMDNIKADDLYNTVPSVANIKGWYVHARVDHPEIRAKFFELIRNLDGFKAHIVISKKDLNIFTRKHNSNPTEYYFDVLHHLLNRRLYDSGCQYNLYLSQRRNSSLNSFQAVVDKALVVREPKGAPNIKYNLEIVPGKEMPELSIIDYLLWAVHRKLTKGEGRYFEALKNKYDMIIDLYVEDQNGQ
jgi:hypothetical protein